MKFFIFSIMTALSINSFACEFSPKIFAQDAIKSALSQFEDDSQISKVRFNSELGRVIIDVGVLSLGFCQTRVFAIDRAEVGCGFAAREIDNTGIECLENL
jgi:hypothetical protein